MAEVLERGSSKSSRLRKEVGNMRAQEIAKAVEEYQQRRVTTFLSPENDPLGAGYHISQSKIAIGSGGIFGKGWKSYHRVY